MTGKRVVAQGGGIEVCSTICGTRQMMRTTLNLDDEALAGALEIAPGKTKTEVINEALREYTRRRRLHGLLKFAGKLHWEGDLDQLRRRDG
jgi:Arc/MetJ family transcription regulator